jgi:amino acid adenylation domain-containing protein
MEKFSYNSGSLRQEQILDNPTPNNPDFVDQFTKQVTSLSDAKRALLALKLASKRNDGRSKIPRLPLRDFVPLSPSQEALWFLDQLEPNAIHYNEPVAFRLRGILNLKALQKAIDQIVARHEVLRTTFTAVDGVPMQVISPARPVELGMSDLSPVSAEEREGKIQELLKKETRRPFNLSSDLMLRITLLKVAPEEHILLMVMHHIAMDGWSVNVLYREISALYCAFCAGQPSPLAELPIQYADYAVWQREWLQRDNNLARQLIYWKQQLKDIPPLIELPFDRPRPQAQTYRGAKESLTLEKTLLEALKVLSREKGVTLFMILLAAFQSLLHRYTGQHDIVIGSPIAGRTQVDIERLLGFFVNTLVLRTNFSDNPRFCDLLERVRDMTLGAFAHPDIPFETVMGQLKLERSLSRNTLFQVLFVLQNTPSVAMELDGLNVTSEKVQNETAKFDLTLYIQERQDGLRTSFEYSADLFDEATIKRMLDHFKTLLEGIVTDLDRPVSELPLLSEPEKQQLLIEWNNKSNDTLNECVHQLFEQQVERNPGADAVVFEDQRLTYGELNRRANQLAHHLQKHGCGPGTLVAMCMERSIDTVVGLLGVLKIGAAYVPLDPNYPNERLGTLVADVQPRLLLTQPHLMSRFSGLAANVIVLNSLSETIAQEPGYTPANKAEPDDLAYVIYTSGSSGAPKGVPITHRALANFISSACIAFELKRSDRVLQFASLSFDTANEEIFPCLVRGATLVLRTDSMLDSVSLFLQKCRDWQITVLDLPTIYWDELVEQLSSEQLTIPEQLRLVIIGGERAAPGRVAEWQKYAGERVRLLNTYGPTEATVVATMCDVTKWQSDGPVREVPIGRPIPNVQTYVLDNQLNPMPIGVPGELHIGGVGLARGYLNRPELTAEKFIANPFSNEPGARLYKTGDLARYLADGNMEFIGRADHQVKMRGFRIELGEIESVLVQHPEVSAAAVLARVDDRANSLSSFGGAKRLVAYVASRKDQACTENDLRSYLKRKLPDYMLPSVYVFLDTLPVTPNGKVDRKALPVPGSNRPELAKAFVAPRSPLEEILAGIWARLLKLDKVGIHDNFFELGGHSLLATQVISQVRHILRAEIALRSFFAMPTIAQLANEIEAGKQRYNETLAPKILPIPRRLRPVNL